LKRKSQKETLSSFW